MNNLEFVTVGGFKSWNEESDTWDLAAGSPDLASLRNHIENNRSPVNVVGVVKVTPGTVQDLIEEFGH